MNTSHQVLITGPAGAPPETAAIRFMALVPADWRAEPVEFLANGARLRLTAPTPTTAAEFTRTATGILSQPGLRDWSLAEG
ncbi:hypothetical protein ACIP93_01930 [Streptomyces sp. NPDC088745]|uniref:hypothetical protein n=1 Tax=Streptomyces sp. NPDC088745 TaxID=3365884 RepID=UPI0038031935